jgi:Paraquat-inducible protein A
MLMRLSIPIVILGNIGLFLSGHLSLAANVSVSASLAGQSFNEEGLFEFSVANSTIELWRGEFFWGDVIRYTRILMFFSNVQYSLVAGGRGLAMIIFLLSFAWPYSKQLIVLGLWFASPATVSVSTRGSTLMWLDLLGKWSIVDIFVLVMVLVGFRISIQR